MEHVWEQVDAKADKNGWKAERRFKREGPTSQWNVSAASDKDAFLAKVCKAYMAWSATGAAAYSAQIRYATERVASSHARKDQAGAFDVVLTNPPFGKKIVVKGRADPVAIRPGLQVEEKGDQAKPGEDKPCSTRTSLPKFCSWNDACNC